MVKAVSLEIPLQSVNEEFIDELEKYTVHSQGKVLKIHILDEESNMKINLFSRNKQVDLSTEFIEFLNNSPELNFKLV
jgi:hypothetical protein